MAELPLSARLLRANWQERMYRSATNSPLVRPEFVAEAGNGIRVVDVRDPEEMVGPFGHVPGAVPVPPKEAPSILAVLGPETPVVLVSNRGSRASAVAEYLELIGHKFVAAMDGGMAAWKRQGLEASRDPGVKKRVLQAVDTGPTVAAPPQLTRALVENHVAGMGMVRWIKMAGFLLRGRRSCVDGRDDHAVIGTPGGDMGEFILALAAYEEVTGARLTAPQVDALMRDYVDTFGRVYYHNDTTTVWRVIPQLKEDPQLKEVVGPLESPLEWRTFLRGPPQNIRGRLLEFYTRPDAIGCGHIRLMMQHPDEYHVRAQLVADAVGAFWRIRWEGFPEFEYVILGGSHGEGAVLQVTVEDRLWAFSSVPLVSPNIAGTQAFIFHSQVAAYIRENFADWMVRAPLPVVPASRPALAEAVVRLGHLQRVVTLGRLAKGLPGFEVRFRTRDQFTVTEM